MAFSLSGIYNEGELRGGEWRKEIRKIGENKEDSGKGVGERRGEREEGDRDK